MGADTDGAVVSSYERSLRAQRRIEIEEALYREYTFAPHLFVSEFCGVTIRLLSGWC